MFGILTRLPSVIAVGSWCFKTEEGVDTIAIKKRMLKLEGSCYPKEVVGVNVGLACVDGLIAVLAFYQLMRIHSRNPELGWTRQKVFHLMIGSSNFGYLLYFGLAPVAACEAWLCWSHSCGFIIMAFPKIVLVSAFLLLLSFWVDLCHQSNEEEDDEGGSPREALLEKMNKTDSSTSGCRNCCSFWFVNVGSRQKVVILVSTVVTAIMLVLSLVIWIESGKNPIASGLVAQIYVDFISVAVLLLGGALACYGLILVLKMRKVRSERASSEMWKVAGLAIVCAACFTSSASVAIATNIPLFYHWHERQKDGVFYVSLLLILYYFIGSSVPSAFVLFVMRELPSPPLTDRKESSTITFISDGSVAVRPQRWTSSTIVQNQVSRASPI